MPQIDVDVDRERVKTYGVSLTDVFETLQVYLGSLYVNDFNRFGRTYQVNAQAEAGFRLQPEQIRQLQTRNDHGAMVPLGSLMTVTRSYGPDQVMHYNGYPAAEINGAPAPGFSSGQAQAAIADVLDKQLPPGMSFEWTELAYQELLAGNTMLLIFPLCVLLVYIVLAAQYESWTLPLTVILIVPMTLFSAIAGVWLTGGDNNVFTQISFLVLAGLACKNAILIVEFAQAARDGGRVAPRRHARGVPHPAAPDSDDLDGVHHGRRSAGLLLGRRLRNPTGDGHRRVRRHARRHALRPVPDSSLLHGDRPADGPRYQARSSCADRQRHTGGRTLIMEPLSIPAVKGSDPIHSFPPKAGFALVLVVALSVSACAVRAPYKAPTVAPTTMKNADPALVVEQAFDPRWWGQFEDPVLDELVSRALTANHDVRIAVARLDQARAIFDDVRLDQYPTVTAGASVDRRSEQVPGFSAEASHDLLVSPRLRRVLGNRCVRPHPQPGAIGGRNGRELSGQCR